MVGLIFPEGRLEYILHADRKLGSVGQSRSGAQEEAVSVTSGEGLLPVSKGAPEIAKVRQLSVPPQ